MSGAVESVGTLETGLKIPIMVHGFAQSYGEAEGPYSDMLRTRGLSMASGEVLVIDPWDVPVGAEAYDADGELVVAENVEDTFWDSAGMIVFKAPGNYEVNAVGGAYEILMVAGGGGSGIGTTHAEYTGGGGAGGGLIHIAGYLLQSGKTNITVGNGGSGSTSTSSKGNRGEDTLLEELITKGGGGGGSSGNPHGYSGGCGGGGGRYTTWYGNGGDGVQPDQEGDSGEYGYGREGAAGSSSGAGGGGGTLNAGSTTSGGAGRTRFGTMYGRGGGAHDSGDDARAHCGDGGRARGATSSEAGRAGTAGIVILRWGGYAHDYDPNE